MASPTNVGDNNENTQGDGSIKNNQTSNEPAHSNETNIHPNTFRYQSHESSVPVNGMGMNSGNGPWGGYGFGKVPGNQQYLGMPPGAEGYDQDEASFVQNFAVQQQPFFGFPYAGGFSPFANPLYSQLGYFGQPFADPQAFMGLNGQNQPFFGLHNNGFTTENTTERSDPPDGNPLAGAGGGTDLLMNIPGAEHLYSQLYQHQLGNALANLSLHDVQDQQRMLQQQLYQQQLLQLQQQQLHQQIHQQILLHTQQLAMNADGRVDGSNSIDSQPVLGLISNPQQTHQELGQETGKQDQEKQDLSASDIRESEVEAQQTESSQKPKQEGPRSWASILSGQAAKKTNTPAITSSNPPSTSTTSITSTTSTSTTPTATTTTTTTSSVPGTIVPATITINNTTSPAGTLVPVKRDAHTTKSDSHRLKIYDKFNPTNFDYNVASARFFVIKSYSEDDIHKSIKYNIWASTDSGNRRLDAAYKESSSVGPIYLFFSVNASGQFCGMARMTTALDYSKKCELWAQDKWNGQFGVHWIFIKDIPNSHLRYIRLVNNENKPVTNSRDTQEIFLEPGREMLRIFTTYVSKTSILDDFSFYDKRQEQMKEKKQLEGEVVEEAKPENNELLPLATGENRKQRTLPPGTKVASPTTQQQSNTSGAKSNSPQTYAKSVNGFTTKVSTQSTGGNVKGKK